VQKDGSQFPPRSKERDLHCEDLMKNRRTHHNSDSKREINNKKVSLLVWVVLASCHEDGMIKEQPETNRTEVVNGGPF
jgi:hypothetical protein